MSKTDPRVDSVESAERTVAETELVPGETTAVEVVVETEGELGTAELVRITEGFSPAFADVETNEILPGGGTAGPGPDGGEFKAVWNEDADEYTVSYDVTVPDAARPGDEFDVTGTLEVADHEEPLPTATIAVDATGVELDPADASVDPGEGTTVDVVVTGADDGVGSYSLNVATNDTAIAEFTDVELTNRPNSDDSEVAADGSSVLVEADMGENAHEPAAETVIAEITVETDEEGTGEFVVDGSAEVDDSAGQRYTVDYLVDAALSVQAGPSLADYADEQGIIDTDGLQSAISDWSSAEIDTGMLVDVISHWSSGDPVS